MMPQKELSCLKKRGLNRCKETSCLVLQQKLRTLPPPPYPTHMWTSILDNFDTYILPPPSTSKRQTFCRYFMNFFCYWYFYPHPALLIYQRLTTFHTFWPSLLLNICAEHSLVNFDTLWPSLPPPPPPLPIYLTVVFTLRDFTLFTYATLTSLSNRHVCFKC